MFLSELNAWGLIHSWLFLSTEKTHQLTDSN